MRLGIDVRESFSPQKTGKGQWLAGFLQELSQRDVSLRRFGEGDLPGSFLWHLYAARAVRRATDLDYYVSPTSFIVPALLGKRIPYVPIIHDLIAFLDEPHERKAKIIERALLGRTVRHAAHIYTVSKATKRDLLNRFPSIDSESVSVIGAGPMRETVEPNVPNGNTILCAATLCPRKNQLRLLQAYARLSEDLRAKTTLVLVGGRGWQDELIIEAVKNTEGATYHGYVSDEEYRTLLSTCTIFALPSLYEGFGMQILDALQRGIPVLTSDRGSLQEVTGDAAELVDPADVSSIASGLERLLTNTERREDLRRIGPEQAKNFSWKKTVDAFLTAIS